MAQDDIIDLDAGFAQAIAQRFAGNRATTAASAALPTASPAGVLPSSPTDLPQDQFMSPEDMMLQQMPKSTQQLTQEAGILNEGIPTSLRFALSSGSLFDPELNKKNIEYNLKRYFKDEGVITDDYDLGLRLGPVSKRLEFRDPRFSGKYNVVDPFGLQDIGGDIADISVDTLLPIATEVAAGVGTAMIPGVGQTPAPIIASSLAALGTSLGRLKVAQQTGVLSPEITDEDIVEAMKEAGLSAAFGFGGQAMFDLMRPVLRGLGLANPKFDFDINEDVFIKAYNKYINSPAGKAAAEKGITPSSAQVLEAAGTARSQAAATELAEQEARIARSSSGETAEAVLTPSRQRTQAAEEAIRTQAAVEPTMPAGVQGTAEAIGEAERAAMGQQIQQAAGQRAVQQRTDLENVVSQQLSNVERAIDDAVNLPATVGSPATIGQAAKDAVGDAYDVASARLGKGYEDLFNRWSEATGISIDSVQLGKGGIKPTEAVDFAVEIRNTLPDRPFAAPSDNQVITKVLDSFLISEKGAARKVKPISLRTLNENIRDLRRLERKAYNATLRGEDAPSPEVISGMVESLEKARNRVISRKDAPEGLADELKALDDQFADFSKKFRNTQMSAVAKLRGAKNPEVAWNLLFQKDSRGGTAVLDIAGELNTPANKDLFNDIGATVRKKWQDTVVKRDKSGNVIKVDLAAHNRFMDEYGAVVDTYLSPREKEALMGGAKEFADAVTDITARQQNQLQKIQKQFELSGGTAIEPETIFEQTWKNNRFTRMDELYSLLRQDPVLSDTFKAFVYKDMFDPAAKRVKTVNGRQVIDPDQMQVYVDANKDKLSKLLGQEYVNNLNTVLEATKIALTDVPRRGAREESNLLTGIIRGYVGMFTRPGRFLTAFNRVRGQVKEDALTTALADPRVMAGMAKASKQAPTTRNIEKTIGRVLLGRYDYATDEDLNVDKPSGARAILQELEAGNR